MPCPKRGVQHSTLFLNPSERRPRQPTKRDRFERDGIAMRTTNVWASERASECGSWVSELSQCSLPYFARVLGPRSLQPVLGQGNFVTCSKTPTYEHQIDMTYTYEHGEHTN